jgi:drug/metabolite transporter (DMT)-like permease
MQTYSSGGAKEVRSLKFGAVSRMKGESLGSSIRPLAAYFCLGLSMFIVGSNIGIGKLILQELPVFLFAALRFFIASVVLAAGMFRTSAWRGFNGTTGRGLFLQSFFGCFLFSLFMLYGVKHTSSANAGIITSVLPSLIALLAWIWLREQIGRRSFAAIGLAVSGIALINLYDASALDVGRVLGNALVLGAVLSEALFAVFSRRLSLSVPPWSMAFWVNVFGLVLFLPFAIPQALSFDWGTMGPTLWAWVLLYSLTASVLSFLLWYKGISQVPANVAGLFTGLIPVSAMIIGFSVLGESPTLSQLAGMVLVLLSLVVGTRLRARS